MREFLYKGNTLPEAYHAALVGLNRDGEMTDCPDWNCTQKEISATLFVEHPLGEPMISACIPCDYASLEQYRQEMLDGILDFEIARGNWEYTYHNRMVDYGGKNQIDFVVEELKRNPYSRRAVIDVRRESDMYTSDPACLQHIQFFIRNEKLDCCVLFRSNDCVKAMYMNAFAIIMIQKKVADALGIEVGTYSHRANSCHCYESDYALLKAYAKRIENGDELAYYYEGDWKDNMEDEKEAIAAKVEKLKNQK